MIKKTFKLSFYVSIIIVFIIIGSNILPNVVADKIDNIKGFDKGPSYKPVVPMKRVTFVNFDENNFLDDYAYLAAVPTTVFNNKNNIFSYPLLFYQDEYPVNEEKERSLNARQGIDYFMEDWIGVCYGQLDQITLINVPKNKLDSTWKAKEYTYIQSNDIYDLSSKIALLNWAYSDEVVIAVVKQDFDMKPIEFSGAIDGTIPGGKDIKIISFKTEKLDKLNPRYHEFTVPIGYTYLKSRTWWASFEVGTGKSSALPININSVIPAADPDSQLYCRHEDDWMMVAITSNWNIGGMDKEKAETYVYKSGDWRLGITDIPTKGIFNLIRKFGTRIDRIKNILFGTKFQTDITMYPGIDIEIPESPPFGCRDATFKLTWNNPNVKLGFCIIGPAGEEIISATDEESEYQEIHLDQLGENYDNKNYKISVFRLSEGSSPINFKVEYSWNQNFSKEQADSLTSATEGAVLASILNAPLIFLESSNLSETTEKVLYKLGVKKIHLLDINSHLSKNVENKLKNIVEEIEFHVDLEDIYKTIMDLTGQNDIIFTTIDPWTRWLVYERKPYDETKAALFIGPAAYIAAHHGSPVLIVDNHPQLSSAIVFHTEYWKRKATGYQDVTVGPMFLTGREVYKFLKNHDYDREGEETMITVADQFEFGAPWDRTFVGKAKPGRIYGSPVDTAYWISRCVFYPALIFQNPAMNPDGITLIQGSYSKRRKLFPWGKIGLNIYKKSQEEKFTYPVLQMLVCYELNLNDVFEKYYHFKYKTATDIIPGETPSMNPIDQGMVPGETGAIWPDISNSEVVPKYLEKGGFGNVFSTSFQANVENLNNGVLMWITSTHGDSANSGLLLTWDPKNSIYGRIPIIKNLMGYTKQENPWRGYDWYLGSTDKPNTMTMEFHGLIAGLLRNPNINGLLRTGLEIVSSEKPYRQAFFKLLSYIPILRQIVIRNPWLADSTYYQDGLIIAHTFTALATAADQLTGINLDDNLKNVHSCGWINSACLPAYKYLHLTMVRHGSAFQVIDPWPTSWYGTWWLQTIPRDIILGDTIGEAYMKGIQHVGVQYVTEPPEFWWDISNNVCLFGDPDLRPFVPDTKYSDKNHWEKKDIKPFLYDKEFSIDGHMPFGATSYPNEKKPLTFWQQYLWLIVILSLIIILLIIAVFISRRKK